MKNVYGCILNNTTGPIGMITIVATTTPLCAKWTKVSYTMVYYGAMLSWWRHQMETFSALLDICAGNSPGPGEFPAQRPVSRSFKFFFDLRLNKQLSKEWRDWWFETQSHPLRRHCNVLCYQLLDGFWYFATLGRVITAPACIMKKTDSTPVHFWRFDIVIWINVHTLRHDNVFKCVPFET